MGYCPRGEVFDTTDGLKVPRFVVFNKKHSPCASLTIKNLLISTHVEAIKRRRLAAKHGGPTLRLGCDALFEIPKRSGVTTETVLEMPKSPLPKR
jgi:hypothetical protein